MSYPSDNDVAPAGRPRPTVPRHPRPTIVGFRSLTENIDTTTIQGDLLFNIFGALAQFERALIAERVNAGLAAAARRGRHGGRPRAVEGEKLKQVMTALDNGASKAAVCRTFNLKRSTLIDTLKRVGWGPGNFTNSRPAYVD